MKPCRPLSLQLSERTHETTQPLSFQDHSARPAGHDRGQGGKQTAVMGKRRWLRQCMSDVRQDAGTAPSCDGAVTGMQETRPVWSSCTPCTNRALSFGGHGVREVLYHPYALSPFLRTFSWQPMFLTAVAFRGDVSGPLRGHWPAASRNLTPAIGRELGGWRPPVSSKLQRVGSRVRWTGRQGLARTVPVNPLRGETELQVPQPG